MTKAEEAPYSQTPSPREAPRTNLQTVARRFIGRFRHLSRSWPGTVGYAQFCQMEPMEWMGEWTGAGKRGRMEDADNMLNGEMIKSLRCAANRRLLTPSDGFCRLLEKAACDFWRAVLRQQGAKPAKNRFTPVYAGLKNGATPGGRWLALVRVSSD